ncbi:MAG: nicotinate-nucleotide adenylyltransferase [Bacillota bacterium]|nr:nicotinate-nucleotide adenylyltransferase [Bacillota bacterium]
MIKKGIFGGTFDPIHNGHLHIAYAALDTLNLDKIVFVPAGSPPLREDKKVSDAFLRYELVKLAVRKEAKFEVSSYEINKKGISYTWETIQHFKEIEKETKWYFIAGVDCLMELEKWKNVQTIMENCQFVVYNRPGYENEEVFQQKRFIEKKYGREIIFMSLPAMEISSSKIKKLMQKGLNVSQYLPANVYYAINELGLYK